MEKIQNQPQTTHDGEQSGKHLRLPDLPDYTLGTDGDVNPFDATDSEFLHFVHTLVPLDGEGLDHWTWMERRDFLNWCLDEQVLVIQDGRLVPNEEQRATVPLTHDTNERTALEGTEDAPRSSEEGAETCSHD